MLFQSFEMLGINRERNETRCTVGTSQSQFFYNQSEALLRQKEQAYCIMHLQQDICEISDLQVHSSKSMTETANKW